MKGQDQHPKFYLPESVADNPEIIFAVGDIPGCYQELSLLLEILLLHPQRCIFLGDYVDRGPSSFRVIELLKSVKRARPDWVFLLGNHELMLQENIKLAIPSIDENSAVEEYRAIGGIPDTHQEFLDCLVPYHESESFLFVHGGIRSNPQIPIDQRTTDELCWAEDIDPNWSGKIIVRGHMELDKPTQFKNYIGCCVRSGPDVAILNDGNGRLIGSFSSRSQTILFTKT